MKSKKRWALILGLAWPAVVNLSCSGVLLGEFREAMIAGTASFVEQATFDLLDQLLSTALQPEG